MSIEQLNNASVAKQGKKAVILPLILFIIIATGSFLIYATLKEKELSYAHRMAKEEASKIELLLDAQINEKFLALQRMAERWEIEEGTPLKVWQHDAANYTEQLSGLKAVEWVDSTYHVRWAQPLQGNEKAIGLDIRFNKERAQDLMGAADRDSPTMTPPLDLVQGYKALITYLPLKVNGSFNGFLVGIFSIQDFFGGITAQALGKNYVLSMTFKGQEYFNNGITSALKSEEWGFEKPVQIYDQRWMLNIKPTEQLVAFQQTFLPIAILIAGLIIALLSALALRFVKATKEYSKGLLESEIRHQQLVDGVQDYAIYWLDTEGRVVSWNSGAQRIKQYTPQEIIGQHFSKFYTAEDNNDGLPRKALDTAQRMGLFEGEGWRVRKDGKKFWAIVNIAAIHGSDGSITGFAKVTRDITERRKFENALVMSEERHDLAVRGMNVGLWDWKIATNEMYWSEKLNHIFGITEPNFNPSLEYFSEHLHPDDKEATLKMLTNHLERNGEYNAEYRFRHPNGEYIWVNAAGQAQWNAEDKPTRMVGSVVDISIRKAALSAVSESNQLKEAVLAGAQHMVIATDTNGIVKVFNKAAEQALGYAAQEIIDKHSPAIWHDEKEIVARAKTLSAELGEKVEPGFDVFIRKAQREGSESGEWTFIRKDGSRFPVNLTATTLRNERQEITGYLGVIEDITQRNELERIKRDFTSMVVHELRTPLTAIQGSLGLMKFVDKDLSAKSTDLLNIASKNSDRLILLINDMLDIDKISAGQMQFNIEEKALAPLIKQGIEVNQPYADKFSVSIVASPISETLKIKVDSARLFQVFANLLSNAAKYSKEGDTIEITVAPFGKNARVLIRDHGTGIPEDFRPRIFGKFTQAALGPNDQPKGGTGLGLHICKQIIEQMGGSIGFDTEMGKGTTFWFELPVA